MRNEKWEMEMESHQHITHTHVYDARNAGNHKLDLIAPASIWTLTQIYGSPGWESHRPSTVRWGATDVKTTADNEPNLSHAAAWLCCLGMFSDATQK